MSVATVVASVAAINASTPIAVLPLQGQFTVPPVAATVRSPTDRDPVRPSSRHRRLYRTAERREARIYSLAKRSFMTAVPQTETVALNRRGNSINGMLCYLCLVRSSHIRVDRRLRLRPFSSERLHAESSNFM